MTPHGQLDAVICFPSALASTLNLAYWGLLAGFKADGGLMD